MIAVALASGVLVVWLLIPGGDSPLARLDSHHKRPPSKKNLWLVVIVVLGLGGVGGLIIAPLLIVSVGGAVVMTVAWVVSSRLRHRKALRHASDIARAAQVIESLLGLGHIPSAALRLAAQDCPVLTPAVALVDMGGEPWQVMDDLSLVPGQAGLSQIGRAWHVSHLSGASMLESLQQVRANLEEANSSADLVAGELAGPRATSQMLAVFPLLGLAMAFGLGANPFHFFSATLIGRLSLFLGISLACAGVVWSELVATTIGGFAAYRRSSRA
jgi:tight adherence protein B